MYIYIQIIIDVTCTWLFVYFGYAVLMVGRVAKTVNGECDGTGSNR